ncbi:MAG: hypothetical protein ACRD3L_01805 [Terriglobales bacterium]
MRRIRIAFISLAALATIALLSIAPRASGVADPAQASGWPSYGQNDHHAGVSSVAAQALSKIHWSTPVDLNPPNGEIFIHYGSPLTTLANTTIVPVKVGDNSFQVEAHNGQTGALLWKQTTDYQVPGADFTPGFYPVLDHNVLVIPAGGGTVLVRSQPDQAGGKLVRMAFYGIDNYKADPQVYQNNVLISTPITADSAGNIYFGFVVLGSNPVGLQSGVARISNQGAGSWVSATTASKNAFNQIATSSGPALSPDERKLYVVVTDPNTGTGALLALNSTTLKTVGGAHLTDPSSGEDAIVYDASSSSPTVGPDGDVYFGVLENPFPAHHNRGWLLHFNASLTQQKIPGSFGWDDTVSIVDASLVSSYQGTSKYLLMSKYNNYAGAGGDGVNKIAVLDPNVTEHDPIIPSTLVMNEVLTIKGVTKDPDFPQLPNAVREWCINTAAVDPITKSILANSEDGKLYRWDLTTNTFTQKITLSTGVGEAYTPTVIGTDGTAYGINDAILDAIGQ